MAATPFSPGRSTPIDALYTPDGPAESCSQKSHNCCEDLFDTADESTAFAEAEVGGACSVVDAEGRPMAYGDPMGANYRPARRSLGLDPFGLSPTTTLGPMKLEIHDTWHEH